MFGSPSLQTWSLGDQLNQLLGSVERAGLVADLLPIDSGVPVLALLLLEAT